MSFVLWPMRNTILKLYIFKYSSNESIHLFLYKCSFENQPEFTFLGTMALSHTFLIKKSLEWMGVCVCACIHWACVCVCVYEPLCMHLSSCLYLYICFCMCLFVSFYMALFLCLYVSLSISASLSQPSFLLPALLSVFCTFSVRL